MYFSFPQDTNLEQMVQQMEVPVAFVSKTKVIRDGRAAMCIVRPPSAKELSEKKKNKTSPPQPDSSSSQDAQPKTSPVSSTDTTEGATQQWADGNKMLGFFSKTSQHLFLNVTVWCKSLQSGSSYSVKIFNVMFKVWYKSEGLSFTPLKVSSLWAMFLTRGRATLELSLVWVSSHITAILANIKAN